jgi:AcrR family transcriptional regulator
MPVERVVDAAVALVDEVGPDAFNMRLLAQSLQSSTATLYRHFAGKDEILVLVVDHVLGELSRHLPEPADTATWQDRLLAAAEAMFHTLKAHPGTAQLLARQIPLGPHGLAGRETAVGILLAGGFPPDLAARTYAAIGHYVIGFAIQMRAGEPPEHQDIGEFFRSLDPTRHPATVRTAPFLPYSLDEEFRFGLRLMVDGLARLLTDPAR